MDSLIEAPELAIALANIFLGPAAERGSALARSLGADVGSDALGAPEAALRWLADARQIEADRRDALLASPPAARLLLDELVHMRRTVDCLLTAHAERSRPPEWAIYHLDRVLSARRTRMTVAIGQEGVRLGRSEDLLGVSGHLAGLAASVAGILTAVRPQDLRRCASERCSRWFIDSSKNGSRVWCSMSRCGNRAKAARHYRNRKDPA